MAASARTTAHLALGRDMSLRSRLILGYGIVVSLTLIFGLFMFVHLSAIRNRLEQLSSDVTIDTRYSIVHLQETFSDVVKTDKTGLSKTAHTRWMISAFANFLPGSTIFRLA